MTTSLRNRTPRKRYSGSIRRAIREGIPGADEVISYKIPAYKVDGRAVLYFAGWKEHFSIYPAGVSLITAFKDELASE